MNKWLQFDERTDIQTGKVSFVFLLIVQAILLIMIFYQRYILDRPGQYYNDLAILLGISTVGFWLVNFYLGGALPIISIQRAVLIYLLLVTSIALPYTIIRGLPDGKLWITWILVILIGPGALVGGYSLAAFLGQKRLDKLSIPDKEE